jgi:phage recombination protein Bet
LDVALVEGEEMSEFNYTPEELKALKKEYAKNASDDQFNIWLAECRNRGLVPVKDVVLQIRATKEWSSETRQKEFVKKAVHITTIQALRKLAERTGKYAGQLPSKWVYLDDAGNPSIESEIPLPDKNKKSEPRIPWAAKASVLRTGFAHPITVPARFEAYAQYFSNGDTQSLNSTWANRGPEQLEKCAEALALRKAFPEELGGLYLNEELRDEETVQATVQEEPKTNGVNAPNPVSMVTVQAPTPATEPKKRGPKKKTSPSDHENWGGLAGQPSKSTDFNFGANQEAPARVESLPSPPEPTSPAPSNIHGVAITDDDLPENLQAKPNQDRPQTNEERRALADRVIAIKKKHPELPSLREWLQKQSGQEFTNNIPFGKMTELVGQLETAEKLGSLKQLLEGK